MAAYEKSVSLRNFFIFPRHSFVTSYHVLQNRDEQPSLKSHVKQATLHIYRKNTEKEHFL